MRRRPEAMWHDQDIALLTDKAAGGQLFEPLTASQRQGVAHALVKLDRRRRHTIRPGHRRSSGRAQQKERQKAIHEPAR